MGPHGEYPKKIAESDENASIQGPQWTSNGRRLGYLRIDSSEIAIETRDLNGGPAVRVLSNIGDPLMDYFWLPDGRLMYVLIERSNEYTCNYWQLQIDKDTGKVVEKPRRLTNWTGFCMNSGSIAADGKRMSFGEWAAQRSVYVAELKANGTRIGNPRRLTLTRNKIYPSAWTADSKAVIFNSRSAGRWGIYKQYLEKDTAEPIVASLPGYSLFSELKDISLPRVSPDGTWALYMVISKELGSSAGTKLMRAPVSGGPSELVMTANLYGPLSCANSPATLCAIAEQSQDLKQLIFTSLDPLKGRGHELTRLDVDPKGTYVWALSPDGTQIAALNSVGGAIHILSLRGKVPQQVKVKGWNRLDSVAWAADGMGLFVSTHVQLGSVLLHVDLRGNSQVLWKEEGGLGTCAVPSPDGRHLAISSWTLDSNIWMMENF
jgi:hypothetical protein